MLQLFALLVTVVSSAAVVPVADADAGYPKEGVYFGSKTSAVLSSYLTALIKPGRVIDMRIDYKMGPLQRQLLAAFDVPFTMNGADIILDRATFTAVVAETNKNLGVLLTSLGYTTSPEKIFTSYDPEDESVRIKVFPLSGKDPIMNVRAVLYDDKAIDSFDLRTTSSVQVAEDLAPADV